MARFGDILCKLAHYVCFFVSLYVSLYYVSRMRTCCVFLLIQDLMDKSLRENPAILEAALGQDTTQCLPNGTLLAAGEYIFCLFAAFIAMLVLYF